MDEITHEGQTFQMVKKINLHDIIKELEDNCARKAYSQFIFHAGRLDFSGVKPTLRSIQIIVEDSESPMNLLEILAWLEDHGYVTSTPTEATYKAGQRFCYDERASRIFTIFRTYTDKKFALLCNDGITHAHMPVAVKNENAIKLSELTAYPHLYTPIDQEESC